MQEDELSMVKGEKLHIINKFPDEWLLVQNSAVHATITRTQDLWDSSKPFPAENFVEMQIDVKNLKCWRWCKMKCRKIWKAFWAYISRKRQNVACWLHHLPFSFCFPLFSWLSFSFCFPLFFYALSVGSTWSSPGKPCGRNHFDSNREYAFGWWWCA